MTSRSFEVYLSAISFSATAMKSVNVFFFDSILPWSCQGFPSPRPADVRDGVDEAAVEQREPVGVERGEGRRGRTTVSRSAERGLAVGRRTLLVDERDRDPGAVGRRGVAALGLVAVRVVAAEDSVRFRSLRSFVAMS